jgi:hypothetical protein
VARVVLDAAAEPDLLHHLEVEGRAHPEALGLEQLALALELGEPLLEFFADTDDRTLHRRGAGRVVRRGEDRDGIHLLEHLARQRMQRVEGLDLVTEHLDADRILFVHRDDLDRVSANAELAAREVDVVALVLHGDEAPDDGVTRDVLADLEGDHRLEVLLCGPEPVDAGHGRDDDDIAAAEE